MKKIKKIMRLLFNLFFCYFIFIPTLMQALTESDFYENGKLIEVKDPPYFDTNYNYCSRHILNSPPSLEKIGSFPYEYLNHSATQSLRDAIRVCYWHLKLPPPYYWKGEKTYGFRERWMGEFFGFFKRYSPGFRGGYSWPDSYAVEYSEYVEKYSYLFYWFDLTYDLIDRKLKRKLQEKENELREIEEKNPYSGKIRDLKEDIDYLKKDIEVVKLCKIQSIELITQSFEKIPDFFLKIYNNCIQVHNNPTAIYQRGRIYFDRGDTPAFISDIFTLIDQGHSLTPEMNLDLGKAYNDANLYNHAIKVLSEAIQKNPQLKEAYFESAVSYFETGNLQLALSDYLNYGTRPTFLKDPNYQHFVFSMGAGMGCAKGGFDSAIHFVPSLFSSLYGLGKGLWTLAGDPIGISKEFVEGAIECIDYIRNNLNAELLATLVPELKECIQKWDQLEEEKKGYYVGYVIGRYGVDALICGKSARAIQLYKNLKKANATLTLEAAVTSPKNAEIIAKEADNFVIQKTKYIEETCKGHRGRHDKHVRGANNFQEGKSEITISFEQMEDLAKPRLGTGIPQRYEFGEPGYREIVDFGEEIGIHVHKDTKIRTPTSIGEIHYDKDGTFHVVPVHPDRYKK